MNKFRNKDSSLGRATMTVQGWMEMHGNHFRNLETGLVEAKELVLAYLRAHPLLGTLDDTPVGSPIWAAAVKAAFTLNKGHL
jgi:hypothetical protein